MSTSGSWRRLRQSSPASSTTDNARSVARLGAMHTSDFTYELPETAIAQVPVEPRDAARLLDCRDFTDRTFADLPDLLDRGDLIVVNRTRVRRARLVGLRRDTGGAVELLVLGRHGNAWKALARPSRRLRPGLIIDHGPLVATVLSDPENGVVTVSLDTARGPAEETDLEAVGETPLPPYFTGSLADPERYQTIFAEDPASAAAPTAGLHFTEEVIAGLTARGVQIAAVDLEVGIDTFRPIAVETLADHKMHSERIRVDSAAVAAVDAARQRGGRVVAVGTTVVRTLESVGLKGGTIRQYEGETDLFIRPGYEFRVVDGLITNFHVPGSTLIVLVAAFMGPGWRDAYTTALERGFGMLSFGDAMMVFR